MKERQFTHWDAIKIVSFAIGTVIIVNILLNYFEL